MKQYCVTFQTSFGKLGVLVEAESPEIAILKAIQLDTIGVYIGVEAIQILS